MLIRSLRNFGKIYDQQSNSIADSIEVFRTGTIVDFGGSNCNIETSNDWPDFVILKASMNPIKIQNGIKLIRNENGKNFEIQNIYDDKFVTRDSEIKLNFCLGVEIRYEDNGSFVKDGQQSELHEKINEDFRLEFSDVLFEVDFDMYSAHQICERSINQKIVEDDRQYVSKFYPCGGHYFYGCHPAQIEQCVFRSVFDQQKLCAKFYTFSSLLNKQIDLRYDTERFKKVNFSASPSESLYSKLKDGECRIKLINNDEKVVEYQSCAVSHIAGTNLISIKFKRGNHELF